MKPTYDYIIIGSGLSGLLMAYRMAQDPWFDSKYILILEKDFQKGNDRTWCFWEPSGGEFDDIVHKTWNKAFIGNAFFEKIHDLDPFQYKMIRSSDFYNKTKGVISKKPNIEFKCDSIAKYIESNDKIVIQGENDNYEATYVLNSIFNPDDLLHQKKYPYLKQHFIGWFVKTKQEVFSPDVVHFMDFTIPQNGNTRFMYVLPTSKTEALVEYTLFSEDLLTKQEYETAIEDYLKGLGIQEYEIIEKEQGNIPMTCFPMHQKNTKRMMFIGTAGGWTKPSTGYTFYNSLKFSTELLQFLKSEKSFKKFKISSRYWWYDLILLEVLHLHNEKGAELFGLMFQKRKIKDILIFLNEDGSLISDIKTILSMPKLIFISSSIKSIKKIIFN